MAGDKAELGGLDSKLFFDMGVGRSRRLMVLDLVRTESSFKQIDGRKDKFSTERRGTSAAAPIVVWVAIRDIRSPFGFGWRGI